MGEIFMNEVFCCKNREGDILQEFIRAGRAINRYMIGRLASLEVTPAQFGILDLLAQHDGIPLGRIRDELCCVGSNVTALVDRMESDGLVMRRRHPHDRRVILLHLGPAGKKKLAGLGDVRHCCPEIFAALEPGERQALVHLLRKLVGSLNEPASPGREG